ncbi:MAG: hypothetical protein CMJ42_16835 [Phyllobacteriaceae bacterium]|nr:hypothetical protein [Phyllobacteriaceae bacterium]
MELIPVFAGVLLALMLNNWQENRKDARFINKLSEAVSKELQQNTESLERVLQRQSVFMDTLQHYLDDESVSLGEVLQRGGGLQLATIQNAAQTALLSSKIDLLDIDEVLFFTELNESKKLMNLKVQDLMDLALDNVVSTEKDSKLALMIQISNLIDSEQQLLEMQKDYLAGDQ